MTTMTERRDVGRLDVAVSRIVNYDGRSTFVATTDVPAANGLLRYGVETKPQQTAGGAIDRLIEMLVAQGVTGAVRVLPSHDRRTACAIAAWKAARRADGRYLVVYGENR